MRGAASHVYIDKGDHVATYSMAPITAEQADELTAHDYFCYEAQGRVDHYTAHSYNGTSTGRFISQGGLFPAFNKPVATTNWYLHLSLQKQPSITSLYVMRNTQLW